MTPVAAYFRVSTKGQGEDDRLGLPLQHTAVDKYCADQGFELVGSFEDVGYSGASADRPALAELLEAATHKPAWKTLVVYKWDRIARDTMLDGFIRYRLKSHGITVLSATETNGADPISDLTQTILAAVAQYERTLISARLAGARRLKAQRGGYAGGQPPYGYRAPGDGTLVPNDTEQAVLARLRALRTAGNTYDRIAAILTAEGYPARNGGPWRKSAVHGILALVERSSGSAQELTL